MSRKAYPTSGQEMGEYGRYEFSQNEAQSPAPEANIAEQAVVVRRQRPPESKLGLGRKLIGSAKLVGCAALLAGAGLLANEIREFGFGLPEAEPKVDVAVGPASTRIDQNVFVNLDTMVSQFPLEVRTSLNRPGPSNCDVVIDMTDEDKQVKTTTNSGLVIDELQTRPTKDGRYTTIGSGKMVLTPSSVVWTETPILFEEELKWSDTCYDFNEPNKAMDIAVTTVQQAGQLAAACAIGSTVGESAIYSGIKQYLRMSGAVPAATPSSDIDVQLTNLEEQQDAIYGGKVQLFDQIVGDKIDQYLKDTTDHKLNSNFDGIKDCRRHDIQFSAQQ